MTQQQLDIKIVVWAIGIILSIVGSTFMLGVKMSNETNKIYKSIEAVNYDNKSQQKDIDFLSREIEKKADKSDVDNLREKVLPLYRSNSK